MQRRRVDFPEPDATIRHTTSCSSTSRSMPSSTVFEPNRFTTVRTSTSATSAASHPDRHARGPALGWGRGMARRGRPYRGGVVRADHPRGRTDRPVGSRPWSGSVRVQVAAHGPSQRSTSTASSVSCGSARWLRRARSRPATSASATPTGSARHSVGSFAMSAPRRRRPSRLRHSRRVATSRRRRRQPSTCRSSRPRTALPPHIRRRHAPRPRAPIGFTPISVTRPRRRPPRRCWPGHSAPPADPADSPDTEPQTKGDRHGRRCVDGRDRTGRARPQG